MAWKVGQYASRKIGQAVFPPGKQGQSTGCPGCTIAISRVEFVLRGENLPDYNIPIAETGWLWSYYLQTGPEHRAVASCENSSGTPTSAPAGMTLHRIDIPFVGVQCKDWSIGTVSYAILPAAKVLGGKPWQPYTGQGFDWEDNGWPGDSMTKQELQDAIRALIAADPDRYRQLIEWLRFRYDPRCNRDPSAAGTAVKVPVINAGEAYASYSSCLSSLGLTATRVAKSLLNADIARMPESVLTTSPGPGSSVSRGSSVSVTTNPAMSGTLLEAKNALVRDNPGANTDPEFAGRTAPLVAQECLKLAARSRTTANG